MREVPAKKYRTKLASDDRSALEGIRDRVSNKSVRFKRALALLMCSKGADGPASKDSEIATATGTKVLTVERLGKRCREVGPLDAIGRKKREIAPREIKVTGEVEAHVTRLACSDPPGSQARRTLSPCLTSRGSKPPENHFFWRRGSNFVENRGIPFLEIKM